MNKTKKIKKIYLLTFMSVLFFVLFGIFFYSSANIYTDIFEYFKNKYKKEKLNIYKYDFERDDSFQKVILRNKGLNNKYYIPNDLIYLKDKYIFNSSYHKLRKKPAFYLGLLARDFYENFKVKLSVRSAYRSYYNQFNLWTNGYKNYTAQPGTSEHQLGLAIDLFYVSNSKLKIKAAYGKYYKWLQNNAYKYGFHNSYQKGIEIDGYEKEPWHRRFVGIELATELHNKKLTLTEYYKKRTRDLKNRGYQIKLLKK